MGNGRNEELPQKIGKNQLCPCGSGRKYKYCHGASALTRREVSIESKCPCCGKMVKGSIDLTENFMNKFSAANKPLKEFCKDNGFYFFEFLTMSQEESLLNLLKENKLRKEDVFDVYKGNSKEFYLGFLETAIERNNIFKERAEILKDAFCAHFEGKYTLSVPVLFAQLEGLFREYRPVSLSESFKTIKRDVWDYKLLFEIKDKAHLFNSFIGNLYKGSQPKDTFNRNPILHGVNVQYYSQEHSLLLLMSILEIDMFVFFEKNCPDILKKNI